MFVILEQPSIDDTPFAAERGVPRRGRHGRAQIRLAQQRSGLAAMSAVSRERAMNPVTPSSTRSCGPPLSTTTAGTPLASDSSTTLPNVSVVDGKTKTSADAYQRASSAPRCCPAKNASGSAASSSLRIGPSPTNARRYFRLAAFNRASTSIRSPRSFSFTSRLTSSTSGRSRDAPSCDRSAASRRSGRKRSVSMPRDQMRTFDTPRDSSSRFIVSEGANVASQRR
jgi:hypothetical protein